MKAICTLVLTFLCVAGPLAPAQTLTFQTTSSSTGGDADGASIAQDRLVFLVEDAKARASVGKAEEDLFAETFRIFFPEEAGAFTNEQLAVIYTSANSAGKGVREISGSLRDRLGLNPSQTIVEVYASGGLKGVLSSSNDDATAAGGSVNAQFARGDNIWTAQITLASTEESLTSEFGASMLSPATGSVSGLIDLRTQHLFWGADAHLYTSISQAEWTSGDVSETVAVVGGGALLGWNVIPDILTEEGTYGLSLEAGIALRGLMGDASRDEFAAFREATLGTDTRFFAGLEAGLRIELGRVTAGLQFYWLGGNASGLSDGQVTAGVSVNAPLFRIGGD